MFWIFPFCLILNHPFNWSFKLITFVVTPFKVMFVICSLLCYFTFLLAWNVKRPLTSLKLRIWIRLIWLLKKGYENITFNMSDEIKLLFITFKVADFGYVLLYLVITEQSVQNEINYLDIYKRNLKLCEIYNSYCSYVLRHLLKQNLIWW